MSFNANKCRVMMVSRSHHREVYKYVMHNTCTIQEHIGKLKDLGAMVDGTLSYINHIQSII